MTGKWNALCPMAVLIVMLPIGSRAWQTTPPPAAIVGEWTGKGGWPGYLTLRADGTAERRTAATTETGKYWVTQGEHSPLSGNLQIAWQYQSNSLKQSDPQLYCEYAIKDAALTLECPVNRNRMDNKTYEYDKARTARAILPASQRPLASPPLAGEWRGKVNRQERLILGSDGTAERRSPDGRMDKAGYDFTSNSIRLNWMYKIFENSDPMRSCAYTVIGDTLTLTCRGAENCIFNLKVSIMPICTPGPQMIYEYQKEEEELLVQSWLGKFNWTGQLEFRKNGVANRGGPFGTDLGEDGTYQISRETRSPGAESGQVTIDWNRKFFLADPQHECRYAIQLADDAAKPSILTLTCERDKTYVYRSYVINSRP